MTLEEALKNKYLTFADLTTGLFEEETDEEIFYELKRLKQRRNIVLSSIKKKIPLLLKGLLNNFFKSFKT